MAAVVVNRPAVQANVTPNEGLACCPCFGCLSCSYVTNITDAITYVSKSPDGIYNLLRGAVTVANLMTMGAGLVAIGATSRALEAATSIMGTISLLHTFRSLNYFLNGGCQVDMGGEQKLLTLSEVAFCISRVAFTAVWAAKNKLIDLGRLATGIATLPFFGKISLMSISSGAFFSAMVIIGIERVRILSNHWNELTGRSIAFFVVDLASNIAEAAAVAMMAASGFTAATGLFTLVASATGVASGLLSPIRFAAAAPHPQIEGSTQPALVR
jgi:hypothetical protein